MYINPKPEAKAREEFIQRILSQPLKKGAPEVPEVSSLTKKSEGQIICDMQNSAIKQKRQKKLILMSQITFAKTEDGKIDHDTVKALIKSNQWIFDDSIEYRRYA
jgi:hypothetical protein